MRTDLPTGSVTGQRGWEWNRLQADRGVRSEPVDRSTARAADPSLSTSQRRSPAPEDVRTLRSEIERKERRLQAVIDHYERLLAEKNRQLTDRSSDHAEADGLSTLLPGVLRRAR